MRVREETPLIEGIRKRAGEGVEGPSLRLGFTWCQADVEDCERLIYDRRDLLAAYDALLKDRDEWKDKAEEAEECSRESAEIMRRARDRAERHKEELEDTKARLLTASECCYSKTGHDPCSYCCGEDAEDEE